MSFNFTGLLIMKFKGSSFEERYNMKWNMEAVPADEKIRKMLSSRGFFRFDVETCINSINQYALAAKNIINNLVRQSDSFEDLDYVNEYMEATLNSIHTDFDNYRSVLVRRVSVDSSAVALIDQIKRDLEATINEHRNKTPLSSELGDDPDSDFDSFMMGEASFVNFNPFDLTDDLGTDYSLFNFDSTYRREPAFYESGDFEIEQYFSLK